MVPMKARAAVVGFGRRVRAHRLAVKISQADLGRRSRVTEKFIGEIERGTSNPSLATMVLVADALDCELTELLRQPEDSSGHTTFRTDDVRRAQEAVSVLRSVLETRRRVRKKAR